MMSQKKTLRTFRLTIDLLAHRALVAASGVANPDAYLRALKAQKRAQHYDRAMLLLDEDDTLDEHQLAELLEPEAEPQGESRAAPTLGYWDGPQRDGTELARDAAKARIDAIRATLPASARRTSAPRQLPRPRRERWAQTKDDAKTQEAG